MLSFIAPFLLLLEATATILSDGGCHCNTTIPGCSFRTDWTGSQSTWCLTNQTQTCGTLQSVGYADTCALAAVNVSPLAPVYYTGLPFNVSWAPVNILPDEILKVAYLGKILGTAPASAGSFSTVLSPTAVLATNATLTISTTSPLISTNVSGLTILQSKIASAWIFNNGSLVIRNGAAVPCDGRNITVTWTGIGAAAVAAGTANVTIKSNGGFGGAVTVGTPIIAAPVQQGNTSVDYICPSSFVPGFGGTTYSATITVGAYTITSNSFSLSAAPTQTPTNTPTPTQTPTASLSFGASASITPSATPTPSVTSSRSLTPSMTSGVSSSVSLSFTPSITPSITPSATETSSNTPSPSPTPTPRTVVDIGAVTAAAAAANTTSIAGAVGGIVALAVLVAVIYKVNERWQMRQRRLRRLRTAANAASRRDVYGINETEIEKVQGNPVIMYQINTVQPMDLNRQMNAYRPNRAPYTHSGPESSGGSSRRTSSRQIRQQ